MADTNISTLFLDGMKWADHDPDYGILLNAVGAGSAADTTDCGRDLLNISARSPTVLCFIIQGDEDAIYVGHSPVHYPGNVAAATGYDNLISVLVGNDINSASTFTFPADSFAREANTRVYTREYILGNNMHNAGPRCDPSCALPQQPMPTVPKSALAR